MRTLPLLVLLALASNGCTSSTDGSSATCEHYARALRDFQSRCSTSGTSPRWSELEIRYQKACDAALSLPGTGATSAFVDRCLSVMSTVSCSGLGSVPECVAPPGTLADGSKCTNGDQCASTRCTVTDPSGCGVCAKTLAVGAACGTTADSCMKTTRCVSGTCTKITYGAAGTPCDSTKALECGNGLSCDSTTKTCIAPPGLGQPCPSGSCASGLACDFLGTKTCYAPTVALAGQPCGGTSKAVCGSGLVCKSNVCAIVTYVKPGGDCSVTGTVCEHGACLTATTKLCPRLIPDGGACTGKPEDGVCDDLANCTAGKCQLSGTNKCL